MGGGLGGDGYSDPRVDPGDSEFGLIDVLIR